MGVCMSFTEGAAVANAFHWPRFEHVLCGTQTDRERLGMPERYTADCFLHALPKTMARLRLAPEDTLIRMVDNDALSLVERYAAGQLLALLDDRRLNVYRPEMRQVAGGTVAVGLAYEDLDRVLDELDGLGIDPAWIRKECPRHLVDLAPYRLARFPVTNLEYREFLQDTGHAELPASWAYRRFPQERANHPVYGLTPQAGDAYAAWLSEVTGRRFRLPTEAEWEYAAAGPTGLAFPWGTHFDASLCNSCETGIFDSTPVGIFPGGASPFGVEEMAGNVEEYVSDRYAPYPGGDLVDDHLRQIHGDYRVARGGSFARFRDLTRTRRRHGQNPRSVTYTMGFRLAETP